MMNFIYNIPENAGWVIVGATAMLAAVMLVKLGQIIVEMVKERMTDEEVEEN